MIEAQKAAIAALQGSSAVQAALSGGGGVLEEAGTKAAEQRYPSVTVGIAAESPRSVEQTAGFAGRRISDVYLQVSAFSKQATSQEAGTLDQLAREALDGRDIGTDSLVCYLCELESLVLKERDPETGIWRVTARYHIIARTK